MSIFLDQAKQILNSVDLPDQPIKDAKTLLNSISKVGGITDLIHDAKFQNIINLLTPFVVNYKVNQVLRLLQELAKENQKTYYDPETGFKKYV